MKKVAETFDKGENKKLEKILQIVCMKKLLLQRQILHFQEKIKNSSQWYYWSSRQFYLYRYGENWTIEQHYYNGTIEI